MAGCGGVEAGMRSLTYPSPQRRILSLALSSRRATLPQALLSRRVFYKTTLCAPFKASFPSNRFKRERKKERGKISAFGVFSYPPSKILLLQQFPVGARVAFLLAFSMTFFLLYGLQRTERREVEEEKRATAEAGIRFNGRIRSADGEYGSDGGVSSCSDVIIVGAGVAGSALAYTLGKMDGVDFGNEVPEQRSHLIKDGRRVLVIERDLTEPNRIVGEVLQPGGYQKLVELGLQDCVEEIDAQRLVGYAIYKDGKKNRVSYPLEKFQSDVAGRTFHNGRFVQRLRQKAASLPNVKLEQGTVTSLLEENGTVKGVHYKRKAGEELRAYAPLTVVCDGCFSKLRRSLCSPEVDVLSCFVGSTLKNCHLPYPNHVHVVLADPSVVVFYAIGSTEVRCFVDVPGPKQPSIANGDMANYIKTVVAPKVPKQLHDAFISAIDKGSIRTMPTKNMPTSAHLTPGALLIGDAFNMRHPLTGGGMTVALSDISVLNNVLKPLRDLSDATSLSKCLESFYILRKPVASTINIMASVTYRLFSASSDEAIKVMQQACFDYFSHGSVLSSSAMVVISGLKSHPLSLASLFFAGSIYGIGHLFLRYPFPKSLWIGARMILVVSNIIFPIIKAERIWGYFPKPVLHAKEFLWPTKEGFSNTRQ